MLLLTMDIRTVIVCFAIFIHSITAQYIDRFAPCAYDSAQQFQQPAPEPIVAFTKTFSSEGSPVTITYSCPIAPSGVSLLSELGMEGQLSVTGSMPFLGAVQMEGTLPSTGQATVNYGCGDTVIITQENGNPCGPNAKIAGGLTLADLANVR